MNNSRIIVALDFAEADLARKLVGKLDPEHCRLKIGKELFTSSGPALVEELVASGFDVFLDLKFHDIPNTVAKACEAAAKLGVWMVNVHACGGEQMLQSAREAIDKSSHQPLLIGVTVLTSMSAEDLTMIGINATPRQQVMRLAQLVQETALDGVVCSAQEVQDLREQAGKNFVLVTPGIRPSGSDKGDQKRVMSPTEAIEAGSDYLVIGRPITQADEPLQAMLTIDEEVSNALTAINKGTN